MTDIVERLLDWEMEGRYRGNANLWQVLLDAKAEIERLRAACSNSAKVANFAVAAERDACAARLDAMREALPAPIDSDGAAYIRALRDAAAAIRARGNFSSESDKKLHEGE